MKIILFSALPQEHAAFRRSTGAPWRLSCTEPFPAFHCCAFQKDLTLVETGMGKGRIEEAFHRGLKSGRPALIVSMGFAGSLSACLEVGRVVLGTRFSLMWPRPLTGPASVTRVRRPDVAVSELSAGESMVLEIGPRLAELCRNGGIAGARVITTERPEPKRMFRTVLGDIPSCVDMESFFLCRFAKEEKIPFLSLRSISDGMDDEIDFDLSDISDEAGRVSARKAMAAAVRRPLLVRSFFRLWRSSRMAADSLACGLIRLLSLPEAELHQVLENRIRCESGYEPCSQEH